VGVRGRGPWLGWAGCLGRNGLCHFLVFLEGFSIFYFQQLVTKSRFSQSVLGFISLMVVYKGHTWWFLPFPYIRDIIDYFCYTKIVVVFIKAFFQNLDIDLIQGI